MKLFFRYPYIFLFAILEIFFSAPGQTFLISLFVTPMFHDLGLSVSRFAAIYSLATCLAALFLHPIGRFIDKSSMMIVLLGNTIMMSVGCFLIAFSNGIISLFLGFFLVRMFGQGVFLLTSSTTIAKMFHKNRGRALSIITLGFPLSELVYPALTFLLLANVGWRLSYIIFALSFLLVMLPFQFLLIRKIGIHKAHLMEDEIIVNAEQMAGLPYECPLSPIHYRLKEIWKKPMFHGVILASSIPPIVVTGLLFHQESLFNLHQWPLSTASAALAVYAISKAVASVSIGSFLDQSGPIKAFVALIVLLGVGTLLAGLGGPWEIIFIYYSLIGIALGLSTPVMNMILPNIFGTHYLGEIKGFVATFRNGLTALAPLPLALAIDYQISLKFILIIVSPFITSLCLIPIWLVHTTPQINRHYVVKKTS